jgi:hypothetical protein
MAPLGRKAANSLAGEEIRFHNEKKKVNEVEGKPPHNQNLVAPLFNLVLIITLLTGSIDEPFESGR